MKKILLILLLLPAFSSSLISAEKEKDKPAQDVYIGINGVYGIFGMRSRDMDFETEKGLHAGGGISFEKMVYNNFGLGSGIQYRYSKTEFVMTEGTERLDVAWTLPSVNIPFLMILSLRGEYLALSLEAGAVYSHIFNSHLKTDTDLTIDRTKDNSLKYINAYQIGITAGIIFKLRVTEYADFTLGITAEGYPTNLLLEKNNTQGELNIYNYCITSG